MTTLIPLAGAGSRFAKEGFQDPKPLIRVIDQPMILRAVGDLPRADRWVFLCRTEHLEKYPLRETLERAYPECVIIPVAELTEGQASTCLLARDVLPLTDSLLIGACDNGMLYNDERWQAAIADPTIDAMIFTFRDNMTVTRNPQMYGWVKVDTDGWVERVSVKIPISDDPLHDHAVVGSFWFREARMFVEAADAMIAANTRINNEFYVDEAMNNVIALGNRVKVFEIDKYVCWGTPNDLRTYEYWHNFYSHVRL